jgi:hypothetical protein
MPKALRSSTPILQGWVATETQHHPPIQGESISNAIDNWPIL